MTTQTTPNTANPYRLAVILVTSLFFMWGLSYGLLDVLNKHFQETLNITKARSAWLQAAYFGAYFLMAMPAATLIGKRGYKFAILCGLCLFAAGALLVIPATLALSFPFFVGALFVVASGLAFLETAANPYITLLGDPASSARRLNLSQSFNGLGQFTGPLLAKVLLFSAATDASAHAPVRAIYVGIAIVVLLLAFFIHRTPMPEGAAVNDVPEPAGAGSVWSHRHFTWGVVAQFFYVAAQVCVGAFFINFATEHAGRTSGDAAGLLSIAMLCFLGGRFVGTALMARIAPWTLLLAYAVVNIALTALVVAALGEVSMTALIALFFFMSIMFPTIFALAVKGLGGQTKQGSSYLIMSIVGGAIMPYFMGRLADAQSTAIAFVVPLACFVIVATYGWMLRGRT